MWRPATQPDHEAIVEMCLALHAEDPGALAVGAAQVRRTLATFAEDPRRGLAVVLEVDGAASGYALLVPYYSNELGGEVCGVDELYVRPPCRNRGHASALFSEVERGTFGAFAGTALGVTPGNGRARRLYERLGFRASGTAMLRPARR